jgi:uncharacterized protein (TIGR03382 family)
MLLAVIGGPVFGDWQSTDPYKWLQRPDWDNGMNVLATEPKILADDFRCLGTGRITDIHIWGSWLFDQMPAPMVSPIDLYIFADVPDLDNTGPQYSHPGAVLWSRHFLPAEIVIGEVTPHEEPFFNPNINQIIGSDNKVILYNFFIDPDNAFYQTENTIYWLGVQKRVSIEDPFVFGWKSSADHWNDDAVWGDFFPVTGGQPGDIVWQELIDPRNGQSMDLAFVITPEPASMTLALVGTGALALLRRRRRKR